ncbi:hypothetical protein FDZ73_18080 [bacterium]|nr:MAG: hypothetical protein FDZ73_18080 [bacterium]
MPYRDDNMADFENQQTAYKNQLALQKTGGIVPSGGIFPGDSRARHGTSGPRSSSDDHFSFQGFSSAGKRQQTFAAFSQNDKGSQFAFGSKSLGKDGSIKEGFGFMASQGEQGSHFKMASFGKNHQFSMDISSSGGQQGLAMKMQHGQGGISMNLGFQGKQGPGLALQSGKNGLSMVIDLRGSHGGTKGDAGGMNMSLQMGGKGGLNIGLSSQSSSLAMKIGLGGAPSMSGKAASNTKPK